MKKFQKVAVGGTFDELHMGHKTLLGRAFEVGNKVIIGLSSNQFVSKMGKPHETASYNERRKELNAFLELSGLAARAEIVPLNDPCGLTISGKGLEALVVSKGLAPLEIVAVNMVPDENNTPISTTRIRSGEIDRNGHLLK
jgi:cytidyltransferase-like protein